MGTPALLKYRGYHQALQAQAAALGLLSPIVIDVPCRGLAAAIEKDIHGKGTHLPSLLASYLQPLPQAEVLILACTHFCLHSVRRMIADIAGPGVTLFDPADAAAANLFTWLRNHKLESAMPPEAMPDLRTSREDPALVHRMRDAWLLHRRVS
jgi:glutamate racemase